MSFDEMENRLLLITEIKTSVREVRNKVLKVMPDHVRVLSEEPRSDDEEGRTITFQQILDGSLNEHGRNVKNSAIIIAFRQILGL